MCTTRVTVQQTRSPIPRDHKQWQTLIGLKLNKIGSIAELPDTPEIRDMIAKVAHLVRIIGKETELDCFVRLGGTTAKPVPDCYWICSTFQVSKSGAIRSRKAGAFPPATSSSVRL